jgi:1-acyl-sn-glycerol-3-phosphate acyltransferase
MAYRRGRTVVGFTPRFPPFVLLYHLVLLVVQVVNLALYGLEVRGRENLRGIDRAVLVSNHTLLLDPALVAHALRPHRAYFTMLEETALIPLLGTFVRLLGGIPLPRGSGSGERRDRGIDDALRHLGFVHFFPEGECYVRNQEIRQFQRGAFHAACRRGLPVIPMTTVLRERAWPVWRWLDLPPRVLVIIGAPLRPVVDGARPFAGVSRAAEEELRCRVRALMQSAIDHEGGCKTLGRGMMPRLGLHHAVAMG